MGHAPPREQGEGRASSQLARAANNPYTATPEGPNRGSSCAQDTALGVDNYPADWWPIPGFTGLYEVARDGRVRSLDRDITRCDGTHARYPGVELAVSDGGVSLSQRSCRRTYSVSRLVGSAFNGTPCVVCCEVVSTRPHPWTCSTCDYTPPRASEPVVDLDAVEGAS